MFHINRPSKKASGPSKILNVIINDDIEQNINKINTNKININQINNTTQSPFKLVNNDFVKNIKKTHEEGNCICFFLTLIFYLINSKGKKYQLSTNITSMEENITSMEENITSMENVNM